MDDFHMDEEYLGLMLEAAAKKLAREAFVNTIAAMGSVGGMNDEEVKILSEIMDDVFRQCEKHNLPIEVGLDFTVALLKRIGKIASDEENDAGLQ